MSARRLADMTGWGKRRERHVKERDEAMSDERDERREPPALEGEVDRWYDRATDRVVAVLGTGEMRSFIPGAGWIGGAGMVARGTAIERLAAELAACRARGDEGDGATIDHDEAYGLWQAAEREHQRTQYAVACLSPTALSAERRAVYAAQRRAEIALLRARLVHLEAIDQLLGRATATATPAGEENTDAAIR